MRILHIVHQYLPEAIGGTELYTQTLARFQAGQGHETAVFTPAARAPAAATPRPAVEEGVRVYRVPVGERSRTQVFLDSFYQSQLHRALQQVMAQEQPDLVHIQHLMGLPFSLATAVAAAGIPYVVTLHDYWYGCANAQLITNYDETICDGPRLWVNCARCALARAGYPRALPLAPPLVPLLGYRHARLQTLLRQAKAVIAPSRFTAEIYAQMGIARAGVRVIPHGIRIPDVLPPRIEDENQLRLAFIGGIAPQKGVHVLVAAVNRLADGGVRLDIFGDTAVFPRYVAQLVRQARHPAIYFRGRLPHEQLWQQLAETDAVVVPTLWYETSSLIIQEAFAAGVPVVASRVGAVQERFEHGVSGYFFPPGDVNALTAILQKLQENPAQVAQLRQNTPPVRTLTAHLNDVMDLYHQVLRSPEPGI